MPVAPEIRRGWRTYNFEVAGLHTCIAEGIPVHNDSLEAVDILAPMMEIENKVVTINEITALYGQQSLQTEVPVGA